MSHETLCQPFIKMPHVDVCVCVSLYRDVFFGAVEKWWQIGLVRASRCVECAQGLPTGASVDGSVCSLLIVIE